MGIFLAHSALGSDRTSRIDRVQQVLINLRSLTQSDMHALTEMETTDVEDEEPPTPPKPKPFTPNPVLVGPRMETRWHTAVEVGGKIPYN